MVKKSKISKKGVANTINTIYNRIIHFEIHAIDTKKMAEFYSTIFGWDIKRWDNPEMDYLIVMTGPDIIKGKIAEEPGINGGITKRIGNLPIDGAPVSSFVCTIHVPNVDEYINKIETHGGKLTVPKMAITGMAWLAYCKDIEGNIFGIFEDDPNAK